MTWLKRVVAQNDSAWLNLLTECVKNIRNFISIGGEWCTNILKKVNPLWKDVCKDWILVCKHRTATCNQDILRSSLWLSSDINAKMFFPDWFASGIQTVADIVDSNGKVTDLELVKKKFNLRINILNYFTVKKSVEKFIESFRKGDNFIIARPFIPFHSEILYNVEKGSKKFYTRIIDTHKSQPNHEYSWNLKLSCTNYWEIIYKSCFRSMPNNNYIWLQYRILHRILGTNEYLYKSKISQSDLCRLCGKESESIEHLFAYCDQTIALWNNIKTWFLSKIAFNLEFTDHTKILCYTKQDKNFWPINFILMITRHYIFSCAQKRKKPNIFYLQNIIKARYEDHKTLSKLNSKNEIFSKKWQIWEGIFDNI